MREIALVLCAVYCFYYAHLSISEKLPKEMRANKFGIIILIAMGILCILAVIQSLIGYVSE